MKVFFGALIAVILLGLYVYSVIYTISVVNCVSTPGCTTSTVADITDGIVTALTLIGGLVSALVIAELAITKPGEPPVARVLDQNSSSTPGKALKVVTLAYLLVWIATGLAAFIVGYMQYPKVVQPLTDLGQSWLGLAVAAGYAYFGIRQ
jgi:hypothetical protein